MNQMNKSNELQCIVVKQAAAYDDLLYVTTRQFVRQGMTGGVGKERHLSFDGAFPSSLLLLVAAATAADDTACNFECCCCCYCCGSNL